MSKGWRSKRKFKGGGILLDQGIHMLDMINLFIGETVEVKSDFQFFGIKMLKIMHLHC